MAVPPLRVKYPSSTHVGQEAQQKRDPTAASCNGVVGGSRTLYWKVRIRRFGLTTGLHGLRVEPRFDPAGHREVVQRMQRSYARVVGIGEKAVRLTPGRWCHGRWRGRMTVENMKHGLARRDQIVGDDAPMAAPPHGL